MIYLGIEITPSGFKSTALAETFAKIGEKQFYITQPESYLSWLEKIKTEPTETVQIFIDEQENPRKCLSYIFDANNNSCLIFLVNHRALSNLIHFLDEWLGRLNLSKHDLERSFVLASARRLFQQKLLTQIVPSQI